MRDMIHPDLVLLGSSSERAVQAVRAVYARLLAAPTAANAGSTAAQQQQQSPHYAEMSAASAEICKLSLNCFITMKIAFANSIADVADATKGADAVDILRAIGADRRIGALCCVCARAWQRIVRTLQFVLLKTQYQLLFH